MLGLLVFVVIALAVVGLCSWFVFETITAPTVDEDGRVIDDPYRRMT